MNLTFLLVPSLTITLIICRNSDRAWSEVSWYLLILFPNTCVSRQIKKIGFIVCIRLLVLVIAYSVQCVVIQETFLVIFLLDLLGSSVGLSFSPKIVAGRGGSRGT